MTEFSSLAEANGWATVAAESNKAIDAYLRSVDPTLPEHYGMPIDGVRMVVSALSAALADAQRERDTYAQTIAELLRSNEVLSKQCNGLINSPIVMESKANEDCQRNRAETAESALSAERADHARTRAMLKLMCDAADEMNEEIDRQVIDEMRRAEYDPPDDAEFVIMLTTKQMRALNDPICVCQKYLRDTASASAEAPPRQHVERGAERRAPQEFIEIKRRAITASEKRRPGNRRRAADREGK